MLTISQNVCFAETLNALKKGVVGLLHKNERDQKKLKTSTFHLCGKPHFCDYW